MASAWRVMVAFLVVLAFVVAPGGAAEPQSDGWDKVLVRLQVENRAEQDVVGSIIDLEERTRNLDLWGWANEKELEQLTKLGFLFERVEENIDKRALTMCTSAFSSWECYPTYSQYLEMLDDWAAAYPDIVRKVDIGASTSGSRNQWALKISDNPDDVGGEEDEPELFYTATMHGDELVCYPTTLHLIDYILQNYGTDADITALVDGAVLWVNALANPDGTFNGGNDTVSGATRYIPGTNVDPNRNFPDVVDGNHPDGEAWATETVNMMDFADSHNIVLSANCHAGIELVNYPWDTWADLHPDELWFESISRRYADSAQANSPANYLTAENNGITNGYAWYQASGTRQDYMTYFHGGREVTLELADDKSLDANLLDDHFNYNRDALLGYFAEAFTGIRGLVTDAVTGDPLAATVKVFFHDNTTHQSWVFTDPDVGDYHRMIAPGTWYFAFEAEGYGRQIASVGITSGPATRLDVQMRTALPYDINGVVTDAYTTLAVDGAVVELIGSPFDPVTTAGDGFYEFLGASSDDHFLRVSADGYGTVDSVITVDTGSTTFNVALVPQVTVVVFEEDFEADNGGFDTSGSWQWGTDSQAGAASGTKVWGTVLNNNYSNDANWTLDTPTISIPSDVNAVELVFSHWYATESGFDGGHVLVSVDGGAFSLMTPTGAPYPDQTVDALEDQPGYTGLQESWQEVSFDLLAHAGHDVVIRWRFGSDYSLYDRGWYIDDVKVVTTSDAPQPGEIFADGFENGTTSAWN